MILLRQKLYSKADLEGLTEKGKEELLQKRNELAKQFKQRKAEIDRKAEEDINRIEEVFEKGSKPYKKAVKKVNDNWKEELDKAGKELNGKKYGLKNYLYQDKPKPKEENLENFAKSFDKPKPKVEVEVETVKKGKKKLSEILKNNKKGLIIGGSVLAASGLTYGGIKAYKHYKDKKKSEDLRKKVSGYDNTKKKKS